RRARAVDQVEGQLGAGRDASTALVRAGARVLAHGGATGVDLPAVVLQQAGRGVHAERVRGRGGVGRRVRALRQGRYRAVGLGPGAVEERVDDALLVLQVGYCLAEVELLDDVVEVASGVLEVVDDVREAEARDAVRVVGAGDGILLRHVGLRHVADVDLAR